MNVTYRVKGIAETKINDEVFCPNCDCIVEEAKSCHVTYDGIVAVFQCRHCHFMFVPTEQVLTVHNVIELWEALNRDPHKENLRNLEDVELMAKRTNLI